MRMHAGRGRKTLPEILGVQVPHLQVQRGGCDTGIHEAGSVRGRCVGAPEAVRLVRFGCTGEGEKQIELSNMLHNAVCLTLLYFPYNFHSLFYFVKNTYKTLFHWEGVFLRSSDES